MNSVYGVVSDIHLHNWTMFNKPLSDGVNSRLNHTLKALDEACNRLRKKGGITMYIAGDLFHVRGSLSPSMLNPVIEFFDSKEDDFEFRIIPGNHDLEGKNTNALTNAVQALSATQSCIVCNETTVFDDDNVVMIPWFDKLDDLRAELKSISLKDIEEYTAIIHAPLNGVLKNLPDHGLDPKELEDLGFHRVLCGHYHNHRNFNNVFSIGALTHQTWSDVDTKAGYIIIDNEKLTHYETNAPKFVDFDFEWDDAAAEIECGGNFVRVKLGEATEEEIKKIRQDIESKYGAFGVIVQSLPKVKAATRSASISAGASLGKSIEEWIDKNIEGADKTAVYKNCDDILQELKEVET